MAKLRPQTVADIREQVGELRKVHEVLTLATRDEHPRSREPLIHALLDLETVTIRLETVAFKGGE